MCRSILLAMMALAGCACWIPHAHAQDMPDTGSARTEPAPVQPSSPKEDPGKTTDYVIAGWSGPQDWQFSMGPTRQPEKTVLMLTRRVPGGTLGVECRRRDGSMEIRMVIDGYDHPGADKVTGDLVVGHGGGPIQFTVESPPSGKQDSSLVVSDPVAITDILYAAAAAGNDAEFRVNLKDGRSFGTSLPSDKSITEATARVCDGWHQLHQQDSIQEHKQQ